MGEGGFRKFPSSPYSIKSYQSKIKTSINRKQKKILDKNEQMFYNINKEFRCSKYFLKGVGFMLEREFYRKQIIEMVEKIENIEWLRFIHRMVKNLIG